MDGAGILSSESSRVTIIDNVIHKNTAKYSGGGIDSYMDSPTIINNLIYRNTAFDDGGGIYVDTNSRDVTVIHNTIVYNNAINSNPNWGKVEASTATTSPASTS